MTGLIGWWPLHESSGDKAYDLSGNGNHGSLNGGVTQGVAGKGGLTAYSFDGGDDYLDVGDKTSLDFGPSNFSVNIWFKTNTGSGVLSHKIGGGGGGSLGFVCDIGNFASASTGQLTFRVRDGNNRDAIRTEQSFEDGNWHLATFMRSGSGAANLDIYVDGEKISTKVDADQNAGDISSSHPYQIGAQQNEDRFYFKGLIANNRIYDRVLTPSEVQTLYEWGNGDFARPVDSSDSSAVSRWAFDGDVTDSWGSNNGTDNTSAGYVSGVRGQAKAFDGSGDYVDYGSLVVPEETTQPLTIASWVNLNSISQTIPIGAVSDGGNNYAGTSLSITSSGQVRGFIRSDTDGGSTVSKTGRTNLSKNSWYHVAFTYDGSQVPSGYKIYVNGIDDGVSSTTDQGVGDLTGTNANLGSGAYNVNNTPSNFLDGKVEDARIYSKALSPSEVFELYRWGTRGRDMRKFTVNSRGL